MSAFAFGAFFGSVITALIVLNASRERGLTTRARFFFYDHKGRKIYFDED